MMRKYEIHLALTGNREYAKYIKGCMETMAKSVAEEHAGLDEVTVSGMISVYGKWKAGNILSAFYMFNKMTPMKAWVEGGGKSYTNDIRYFKDNGGAGEPLVMDIKDIVCELKRHKWHGKKKNGDE